MPAMFRNKVVSCCILYRELNSDFESNLKVFTRDKLSSICKSYVPLSVFKNSVLFSVPSVSGNKFIKHNNIASDICITDLL